MRLINTKTGLLEEFVGDEIPEYAILSHTWEKDEISLQEFQRLTDPDFANDPNTSVGKAKAGFVKIRSCVDLAASRDIPYVWVDTCCIDKSSSADLTESINSMYRWYANSKVCFAYLVDVESQAWITSRWFTRGWTLQELIAPPEVPFYCHSWDHIATKCGESSSAGTLSMITGIDEIVLKTNDLSSACVAQKMSWAANRRTTRVEDMAYCLLGLFDVNMPLLYGEGDRAFLRLQEHIAATSTDQSLFAWGRRGGSEDMSGDHSRSYRGIFARSPAWFRECRILLEHILIHPDVWTQTNRGFHAVFPTIPSVVAKQLFNSGDIPEYIDDKDYLVLLNCVSYFRRGIMGRFRVGIWVSLIDVREDGKHGFCRVTDLTTLQVDGDVSKLLDSSPQKFRTDLWFATRTVKVPRDYFSKRLGGFLIQTPGQAGGIDHYFFKIHSLYGTHVSSGVDLVSCPLLPLHTSGGLVGLVAVKALSQQVETNQRDYGIIFGYPPSLSKPFARVIPYFDHEKPLQYDFQTMVARGLYDRNTVDWGDGKVVWRNSLLNLSLYLDTVIHEDMVFTRLKIEILKVL